MDIWASALDFYPNQPVRKQMCQIQSAKVLLFNIYFVILPVSQHVFLLGFFLYACVFDTYQIFECGNQNYYKKLRTHYIFRIMGIFCQFCQLNLCNCLFLGTTICSLCDKIIKFRRKFIRTNFDHEFIMYRVLEFKLQDFT